MCDRKRNFILYRVELHDIQHPNNQRKAKRDTDFSSLSPCIGWIEKISCENPNCMERVIVGFVVLLFVRYWEREQRIKAQLIVVDLRIKNTQKVSTFNVQHPSLKHSKFELRWSFHFYTCVYVYYSIYSIRYHKKEKKYMLKAPFVCVQNVMSPQTAAIHMLCDAMRYISFGDLFWALMSVEVDLRKIYNMWTVPKSKWDGNNHMINATPMK